MTSLVFGNFYFDYYSYRFGLEFRLGFGLGLELGLGLRLVLWVRFFSLNYEMYARTERAPSLFQLKNAFFSELTLICVKIHCMAIRNQVTDPAVAVRLPL